MLSRLAFFALTLALVATVHAANTPANESAPFTAKEIAQGYREHTVLARPHATRRATADADEAREGVRVARKFARFDDLRVITLADSDSADAAIARLQATGRYDFVEPDYIRHATALPNDKEFSQLWGLRNTGQIKGTPGADINAAAAWDIRSDASTVIVAVIDSGVNLSHTDLAANLWTNPAPTFGDLHGARFVNGTGLPTSGDPSDDLGHGTHVAGTIGAVGNNGIGVTGVAWKVQIMAVKFLTASGSGSNADGVACIDYAIQHGATIINASYGEAGGSAISLSEQAAISRARDAGVIFVAAAGNDTANMDVSRHYPASLPLDNIVAVGASTRTDDIAVFSNYGAAVDLFAPGNDIVSLDYVVPDGGTTSKSGTSMAAPHVAGALALIKAQFPADNYRQLINRLLRGVDLGGKFSNKAQTNGRLNLLKALTTTTNRPFNDDFADRPRLAGDNLAIRSSNVGATSESGEPAPAGVTTTNTLWWEWTASGTAPVTITTAGSGYDTVLGVYTGTSAASLALVTANDNDGSNLTSAVSFTAQAGTSYQIAVGGKAGAAGATFLTLSAAPSNDNFATPLMLDGVSTHVTATNAKCTTELGEPRILGNTGGTSLWYRWTAPKSGAFQVSAFSLDFDPVLAVYTGGALNQLSLIAANDNTGIGNSQKPSLCSFNATAGTTYQISIDAKAAAAGATNTGEFTLSLVDSAWQFTTGRSTTVLGDALTGSAAVAPDGSIYFGDVDKSFYALNADGSLKWTPLTTTGAIDTCSPAIGSDGTIYFGTGDGKFYALTPGGGQKWVKNFGTSYSASISPAIAADGTIYTKVGDGKLYALDPANGATKWSFDVRGPATYCSPIVAPDGTIYQGSEDHTVGSLYAINPDGSVKWTFATDSTGDVYSTPAIDVGGNLYFGVLNSGKFYSISSAGKLRWIYVDSAESISSSPALSTDGGTVYFGGYDRKLHALNTTTGAARWTFQLGNQVRASSPAIDANGVIYIGCYDYKLYAVNPDGTLNRTYDTGGVVRSCPAISGNRLYVGSGDHKLYALDLDVGVASGPWSQYRNNVLHTGRALAPVLGFTVQPRAQIAVVGYPVQLFAAATGSGPITYQWFKDGAAISGATTATLSIASATNATAGTYYVVVTSPTGSVASNSAALVVEPPNPGRLINLSVQTTAGSGAQMLTVGFVLSGAPNKTLLVRGIGPGLASFGVSDTLPDPSLTLLGPDSSTRVAAANDNWNTNLPDLTNAMAAAGAFPLTIGSKDAALVATLAAGNYTAQVTSSPSSGQTGANTTGTVLAEIYDTAITTGAKLVNLSTLAQVSARGSLTAGFTISGNIPKTVLIRGLGPALATLGAGGVLADPSLELYDATSTSIQTNDDWGATAALIEAFNKTGAFKFGTSPTKDAALLVTLAPGSYTALVRGGNNTSGLALVEIYEVP